MLVVGGGLAGSTAAAMLAKNGIDVVLLEGTTGLTDVKDVSGGSAVWKLVRSWRRSV